MSRRASIRTTSWRLQGHEGQYDLRQCELRFWNVPYAVNPRTIKATEACATRSPRTTVLLSSAPMLSHSDVGNRSLGMAQLVLCSRLGKKAEAG